MFYEFRHFGTRDYTKKYFIENLCFERHLHQSFEIILATSGEMQVTADDKTYTIFEGDCFLCFPNQIHSVTSEKSSNLTYIFSTEVVSSFTSQTRGKIPENNIFRPSKALTDALIELPERAPLLQKKAVFYQLCAEFDKDTVYSERVAVEKKLLYDIFHFVEKNYDKDCSLQALCQATHFSYSYLSRYFKKITGVSFNEYLNQYKISNARYLLDNTDASVLQCAYDSGYSSLRSFNRNFLKYTNTTPEQYRNRKSNAK